MVARNPRDAGIGGSANAYRSAGGKFNGFSQYVFGRSERMATAEKIEKAKAIKKTKNELYREVRGNFNGFLDKRNKDQPFVYWFGPTNVHRKWIKGSGKELWGIDPDKLKGKMPAFLPDVHAVREDLADYLGEIAAFDGGLGILIDELKKRGEYENTLIVVSGDHGPPGFPHGKCNLYDFGTKVCLAIAGPGVRGGRVVDDFTCLPDLAPTFLATGARGSQCNVSEKSVACFEIQEARIGRQGKRCCDYRKRAPMCIPHVRDICHIHSLIRRKIINSSSILNRTVGHWEIPIVWTVIMNQATVYWKTEHSLPLLTRMVSTKAWIVTNRNDPKVKPIYKAVYGKRPKEELYDLKNDPIK